MMGNYHVRFGKGTFDLTTSQGYMIGFPTSLIITGHAFIMSAPSHSTVDCGRTSQVVLFCVVGMGDLKSPIHLAPLPDRGEPNKTL